MIKPLLSIVIPCYNERERIAHTLNELLSFLPNRVQRWEIIPVDNGSTDNTWEVLHTYQCVFNHIIPLRLDVAGKGNAVREGMLFATGNYRMFYDADMSTPVKEIERGLAQIAHHDIVIGSRELDRSRVRTTWGRRSMGRLFHAVVHDLVPGIRDTQCGFKIFREDAALDLFSQQTIRGWAFDVEILYLAKQRGYDVYEMPINWTHNEGSHVRALSTSFEMLRDVLEIPRQSILPAWHKPKRTDQTYN